MCRSSREVLSLLRFFVPKELQYLTYLHLEAENLGRKINEQFDPSNDYYTFLSLSVAGAVKLFSSEKRLQTMKIPGGECLSDAKY